MTDDMQDHTPVPPQDQHRADMEAFRRSLPPRPKMTLDEQATYLGRLMDRCIMKGPGPNRGAVAGTAILTLTREDYARLWAIEQTLRFLEMHNVQGFIRGKLARDRDGNGGRSR